MAEPVAGRQAADDRQDEQQDNAELQRDNAGDKHEEAGSNVYLIGIKNNEGRPESYAVQLMVDHRITGEWQDLALASGQSMTYPVMVPQGAPAQAWLYRAEQPNAIYRKVTVAGNEVMESETDSAGDLN